MRTFLPLLIVLLNFACSNSPSSEKILERSVRFHDPAGIWAGYSGKLAFEESRPSGPTRNTRIWIDNSTGFFKINRNDQEIHGMIQDSCFVEMGDVTCERANTMRNYYLYLWGLPMKLKDPGTTILPEVKELVIDGNPAYVIQVVYEQDTWDFYFDQDTYALMAYKFVKPDGSGEYIIPEGIYSVDQMRLPTNRSWYSLDSTYLGTDKLISAGEF